MKKRITVKQLIALLKQQDPNAVIVLSSDEEGNRFSDMGSYYAGPSIDQRINAGPTNSIVVLYPQS